MDRTALSRSPSGWAAPGRRSRGFTLIELMIVVVIAAILAAIAFPAYRRQVMESRRTTAKTALLDLASREEKYYSTNNAYTDVTSLGYATTSGNAVQVPSSSDDYYNITVTVGNPPTSYTATATPQGSQANDACGSFKITNLGAQSVTGTASGCW